MWRLSFYMPTIRQIADNLKRWNPTDELNKILSELQQVITGMNKEQLSIGQDAKGDLLMDYATEEYAIFKVEMGSKAPAFTPDLQLTGSFYDGFIVVIGNNGFSISSTDTKTLALEGKYGDIFGLQDIKLKELAQIYILPKLAQSFLNNFR